MSKKEEKKVALNIFFVILFIFLKTFRGWLMGVGVASNERPTNNCMKRGQSSTDRHSNSMKESAYGPIL